MFIFQHSFIRGKLCVKLFFPEICPQLVNNIALYLFQNRCIMFFEIKIHISFEIIAFSVNLVFFRTTMPTTQTRLEIWKI